MGRFMNGMLIGIGVGLLIAPVDGQEMRRLVQQRYQQLRSNLPEKEQVMETGRQVATNLSQTASTVKDVAQQAGQKVKETGQGALDATKQATQAVKERVPGGKAASDEPEAVIVFENEMDV
jgi:gas vesicle protein